MIRRERGFINMNFTANCKTKFSTINGDKVRDNTILLQTGLIISLLTSIIFYCQAIGYKNMYLADLPSHIMQALTMQSYSAVFVVMKWAYDISMGSLYFIGLMQGLTFGLSFVCAAVAIKKLFSVGIYSSMGASACLLILTNIYIPYFYPRFYEGPLISQPWHNITYSSMRPFAVLAMLFFAYLHEIYKNEKRIAWKYWILTCVSLILSTMAKPNFLMGFAPALLVYLLVDFFGKKNTFKNEFLLGCVVLPAVAVLPIQAVLLFNESNSIAFGPSTFFFAEGAYIVIMRFVAALPLPLLVYYHNRHRLGNGAGVAGLAFIFAVLEGMFLMEKGPREMHGNFLWGSEVTGYVLFMYVFGMLLRDLKEYRNGQVPKTKGTRNYLIISFILAAMHMVSGAVYFSFIARGYFYYF